MEQLNTFLRQADYRPFFTLADGLLLLSAGVITLVVVLHTLHLLGQRTVLYRTKAPVPGWNRRFYPASIFMIIFLLLATWLLNVWSHRFLLD